MTLTEAIERYTSNAEYERIHGSLQGCLDFRQLAEWLKDYERLLEQEPCEDDYIKVPKKALKYRTAGMVAYNTEWLKSHFDIERIVICGAQHPCEDAVSKQMIKEQMFKYGFSAPDMTVTEFVEDLPSVNSQKSTEWEHDHEILKAYSDDANEILDEIRAEIDKIYERENHSFDCLDVLDELTEFIDKYKVETEHTGK